MSDASLTTLGVIFLVCLFFCTINKTLSKLMGGVGFFLIILIIFQSKTGTTIIDFSHIAEWLLRFGRRVAEWTESNLLPSLSELARVIEEGFLK